MNASLSITAVIVTFNRKDLLQQALAALVGQTLPVSRLLIVDNASEDGTREMLAVEGWLARPEVSLLSLKENSGGAGGFAAGLRQAIDQGADWVWMMDDDAAPHPKALERLMQVATDPGNIYGSLAVSRHETAWLTTVLDPPVGEVGRAEDVPKLARVQMLPFLGFLVHRQLVERIGLPDAGFFIAADDLEYCVRGQRAGASIFVAGTSYIEHPKSRPHTVHLLGQRLVYLSLPPWKRYYDTRNRLLVARKHHGLKLITQTIPGSLVRLFTVMMKEPHKSAQAYAFFAGFLDGLIGLKGKRHDRWGIKS